MLRAPKPDRHPVNVGQRNEGAILHALIALGYVVLVPWGVNQRHDLLIEQDGGYIRAQCKTGRLRNGSVRLRTNSIRSNLHRTSKREYTGEADIFLVHCLETGGVYAIPVEEAPSNEMHLRVEPSRNNQSKGIHWAKDYELPA
ncbi:MAG: group I intron-associated PD-(D/E)XK endonuclease [Solirubrobacterales bacterium]